MVSPVIVIGLGNELRRDDGVGIAVARRVRALDRQGQIEVREVQGEPTRLLDAWQGHETAVIVDAMRSGAQPGTIRRWDASSEALPGGYRGSSSSHAVALGETIELARALNRVPGRVVVYGVEGRRFDSGVGLSLNVRAAVPNVAQAVVREAFGRLTKDETAQ